MYKDRAFMFLCHMRAALYGPKQIIITVICPRLNVHVGSIKYKSSLTVPVHYSPNCLGASILQYFYPYLSHYPNMIQFSYIEYISHLHHLASSGSLKTSIIAAGSQKIGKPCTNPMGSKPGISRPYVCAILTINQYTASHITNSGSSGSIKPICCTLPTSSNELAVVFTNT